MLMITENLKELKKEYMESATRAILYDNAYTVEPENKDFRLKMFENSYLEVFAELRAYKTLIHEIERKTNDENVKQMIDEFRGFWFGSN